MTKFRKSIHKVCEVIHKDLCGIYVLLGHMEQESEFGECLSSDGIYKEILRGCSISSTYCYEIDMSYPRMK